MYSELELNWLDGIIEGEGCFWMGQKKGTRQRFSVSFDVCNTDLLIIQKCSKIMSEIIGKECKIINHKNRFKGIYRVWIYNFPNIGKFIKIILPYMVGIKKLQAQIILQFIERRNRLNKLYKRPPAYTSEDMKYLAAFKATREYITKSVETIRSSSQVDGDIVRAATISKIAELGRNVPTTQLRSDLN